MIFSAGKEFSDLPHQLETDTQMVAEIEVVEHVYHVVCSVHILLAQFIQYPDLDQGLMVEAFLVANDFDCHVLVGFVVQCPDHLSEAALADDLQDFVPVADVVVNHLMRKGKDVFSYARQSQGKFE